MKKTKEIIEKCQICGKNEWMVWCDHCGTKICNRCLAKNKNEQFAFREQEKQKWKECKKVIKQIRKNEQTKNKSIK